MRAVCRTAALVFLCLYAFAVAILVIGLFGLFGADPDPLAGVYLIPLGLPWNLAVDIFPEPLWPWLAAAAPALNLAILGWLCRIAGRVKE